MYDDDELLKVINRKKYSQRLSERYGIELSQLAALEQDFELVPKGHYAPPDEDPYPGSMRDIANEVDLPTKIVWNLRQQEAIGTPITYADLDFLRRYRLTVDIRAITEKPQEQKTLSQSHPELNASWKRYVFKCYINSNIRYFPDGKMANPEDRIFVRILGGRIADKFGLQDGPELWGAIEKIREVAQNRKRK
jgi:hypothetical protein